MSLPWPKLASGKVNKPSQRRSERRGFREEGRRKEKRMRRGHYCEYSQRFFGLCKNQWWKFLL
jgi:RimJ/RimL family protein N-acetyltransferase